MRIYLFVYFVFYLNDQRLLRMVDGLNFKEFVAFLSAFSPHATLHQKIECNASCICLYLIFIFCLV